MCVCGGREWHCGVQIAGNFVRELLQNMVLNIPIIRMLRTNIPIIRMLKKMKTNLPILKWSRPGRYTFYRKQNRPQQLAHSDCEY